MIDLSDTHPSPPRLASGGARHRRHTIRDIVRMYGAREPSAMLMAGLVRIDNPGEQLARVAMLARTSRSDDVTVAFRIMDWVVREHAPRFLDALPILRVHAHELRALPTIVDDASMNEATAAVRNTQSKASAALHAYRQEHHAEGLIFGDEPTGDTAASDMVRATSSIGELNDPMMCFRSAHDAITSSARLTRLTMNQREEGSGDQHVALLVDQQTAAFWRLYDRVLTDAASRR